MKFWQLERENKGYIFPRKEAFIASKLGANTWFGSSRVNDQKFWSNNLSNFHPLYT
jgi:hypothetical protein